MAEVVDADVRLEAVLGPGRAGLQHTRIVDEDVDRPFPGVGELPHRLEAREVQTTGLDVPRPPGGDGVRLRLVADGEHDAGAGAGQFAGGDGTDSVGRAGDDDGGAGQVLIDR